MNTKSLLIRIGTPVLALGLLGGFGATLATSASAATLPAVTASTHLNNHPDTTSLLPGYPKPGQDATVPSPGGPVWAYDNVTEKFTVVPETAPNTYSVTIDFVGSFNGFADPTTAAALSSAGSVKGTIQYDVSSLNAPNPANLPGQTSGNATLSDNINTLFGGSATSQVATVFGWGPYLFSYQNGNYTQYQPATGSYVQHGDVTGH